MNHEPSMALWLVQKREPGIEGRWHYDCAYGFVIRSDSEAQARALAANSHGDEGADVWADPELTSCRVLTADGPAEVVMQDFLAG